MLYELYPIGFDVLTNKNGYYYIIGLRLLQQTVLQTERYRAIVLLICKVS